MLRRRSLLAAIAAASVGGATTEPLTHLLDGLPSPAPPDRVGLPEVAAVEETTDLFTAMDLQYGGGLASELARGSLRWATGLLDQRMTDDTRARLHSAVASLGDRVAWSYYDSGSHVPARRLYGLALNTAALGADRNLRAHIMLNLSTLTYDTGQRSDAVEVLRLALGDDRVSDTERANLHIVCARHCGGIGERHVALRHIGMAEEALTRADPRDAAPWAQRVTAEPGHFDSALGLAHFALGEDDKALERFTNALAALGPGRVRTSLRCRARLAVIHMRNGSSSDGETEARQVLNVAEGVRSARIKEDLRMLATHAGKSQLHDLRAELDAALTS